VPITRFLKPEQIEYIVDDAGFLNFIIHLDNTEKFGGIIRKGLI